MSMISPRIRPGRGGYVAGVAIIVIGVVAGVGLLVGGVVSAIGGLPKFTSEIAAGSAQSVTIDRAGDWAVYAAGPSTAPYGEVCLIEPSGAGNVTTEQPSSSLEFTRGGRQWRWLLTFTVDQPGTYRFTCRGSATAGERFAVGEKPNVAGFAGRLVGGIVGVFALPCLGLVIGGVLVVVTAVRRSAARRRAREAGYPVG